MCIEHVDALPALPMGQIGASGARPVRTGVSLLEVVIVAAIIGLAIGGWLLTHGDIDARERVDARDQEYFNRMALLESRLRLDLRSAVAIRSDPVQGTVVTMAEPGTDGGSPRLVEVGWRLDAAGTRVIRATGGTERVFDFSGMLGGKRFVLRITP